MRWPEKALAVLVAVVAVVFIVLGLVAVNHRETYTACTVIDKDRTRTDSGSDMRVYTENCGVFKVQDTVLGGVNFNSADTFSRINVGTTYDIDARGFRIGVLSWFPVVMKLSEVPA